MSTSFYQQAIYGALAGSLGFSLTVPLDYLKTYLQSGMSPHIISWRHMYRGFLIGNLSIIPQMAIKFSVNHQLTQRYQLSPALSSFLSGACDGAFLGPLLAIQAYQQLHPDYTITQIIRRLRQQQTIGRLIVPMAGRNAFYSAPVIGLTPALTNYLFPNKNHSWYHYWISATILNVPGCLLCSPWEVARINYLSEPHTLVLPINQWYRGFWSLLLAFGLRFPLTLAIYYTLNKSLINPVHQPTST